ncbi:lysophospholipid acyltransferase family protein [Streptomyces sp. NPDC004609]|uniref:lysophospholipid acyltransferase family protein n=1 Tax=Streptomyces sp. NPDC004609 TaxID=3364704 RepID=UPI00367E9213
MDGHPGQRGAPSPWLPGAPCTPGDCAGHGRTVSAPTAAARLSAGLLTVLAGVLIAPVAALVAAAAGRRTGTRLRHRAAARWSRAVLGALGVRVRITGHPGAPGALVVANHISWLDIPLIAAVLPGRMLAKAEIARWPVLGALAAGGGTVFLERDRLRTLPGTVRTMASALAQGARIVAFPEGSTWCGRRQGRFRHAVFQAALDAGAAVQPVRVTYRPTAAAAFVGDDTLPASLWRVARAGGLTAEIRLLPVIPAGSHPDRRSLARAAERAVRGSGPPPSPGRRTHPGTVASESANLPAESVHHRASSMSAAASSARTPS